MRLSVVWVDREHSKLFEVSGVGVVSMRTIERSRSHHSFQEGTERGLFERIVAALQGAEKVLILGPGIARLQFHIFLREQHPSVLRRVIACECSENLTEAQVLALAHERLGWGRY